MSAFFEKNVMAASMFLESLTSISWTYYARYWICKSASEIPGMIGKACHNERHRAHAACSMLYV